MTVPGGRGAVRRTAVIVAGLGVLFFAAVTALNWLTASIRHHDVVVYFRTAPAIYAAAFRDAPAGNNPGTITADGLGVAPQHQVHSLLIHSAVQSLLVAAVLLVVVALARVRRSGVALIGAVGAILSITGNGGILGRLTPPIKVATPRALNVLPPYPNASAHDRAAWVRYQDTYAYFGVPMWWRIVITAAVMAFVIAAIVLVRQTERPGRLSLRSLVFAAGVAAVAAGFVGLRASAGADDTTPLNLATLGSFVLLAVALAAAGAAGSHRLGLARAGGLGAAVAVAGLLAWWTTRRPGGSPDVYGFFDMGDDPASIGPEALWVLLVAAAPAGWLVAEAVLGLRSRFAAPQPEPA